MGSGRLADRCVDLPLGQERQKGKGSESAADHFTLEDTGQSSTQSRSTGNISMALSNMDDHTRISVFMVAFRRVCISLSGLRPSADQYTHASSRYSVDKPFLESFGRCENQHTTTIHSHKRFGVPGILKFRCCCSNVIPRVYIAQEFA